MSSSSVDGSDGISRTAPSWTTPRRGRGSAASENVAYLIGATYYGVAGEGAMSTEPTRAALKGVKVIELGGLIAGPYATSLFAQFGADVIKIEAPGEGDPLRRWRKLHNGTSLWWYSLSRNKQSLTLNLKSEQGRRIVRALVKDADILVENFRPGT